MTWFYNGNEVTEIPDGFIGFVYLITNLSNGKKYVGKKNAISTRRVKQKHSTRRKVVQTSSDWMDYFGSSAALLSDIDTNGADNFRREILHYCRSKAEMAYLEIKEQIERKVLFDETYYNNYVGCRIHAKHFKGWIDG